MTLSVRQSTATTVRMVTDGSWSAPSLSIVAPDGTSVSGGTATLDSTSTTLDGTPANAYTWVLSSASGFEVGRWYAVTTSGVRSVCQVSELSGTTIVVEPAPVKTPASGDPVVGVEVAVTVPAIGERGYGYQIVLTEGDKEEREGLDVVRRLFLSDYRDTDLRRKLAEAYPSSPLSELAIDGMVSRVREEIRAELLSRGAYPNEWVDPSAFRELGHAIASRLLATERGIYPIGVSDREAYLAEMRSTEARQMSRIVNSYQARDADSDGAVDEPSVRRFVGLKRR